MRILDGTGGGRTLIVYEQKSGNIVALSAITAFHGTPPPKQILSRALPETDLHKGLAGIEVPTAMETIFDVPTFRVVLERGRARGLSRKYQACKLEYGTDRKMDQWGAIIMKADGKDTAEISIRVRASGTQDPANGEVSFFLERGTMDRDVAKLENGEASIHVTSPRENTTFKLVVHLDGAAPICIWFRAVD